MDVSSPRVNTGHKFFQEYQMSGPLLELRGGHMVVFQVKVLQFTLVRQLVENVSECFTFRPFAQFEVSSSRSRESLDTCCFSKAVGSCHIGGPFLFCRCAISGGL